jgi:transposase
VAVDGLGNPLPLRLTGRQIHDVTQVPNLIDGFACQQDLADRGYTSQAFVELIHEHGAIALIPPHQCAKTEHEYDRWVYRECYLLECLSTKLSTFDVSSLGLTKWLVHILVFCTL